jgi:hypothetical protein
MQVLATRIAAHGQNRGIRFTQNHLVTYTQEKRAIAYFYGKRWVCDDGIHTRTIPRD